MKVRCTLESRTSFNLHLITSQSAWIIIIAIIVRDTHASLLRIYSSSYSYHALRDTAETQITINGEFNGRVGRIVAILPNGVRK